MDGDHIDKVGSRSDSLILSYNEHVSKAFDAAEIRVRKYNNPDKFFTVILKIRNVNCFKFFSSSDFPLYIPQFPIRSSVYEEVLKSAYPNRFCIWYLFEYLFASAVMKYCLWCSWELYWGEVGEAVAVADCLEESRNINICLPGITHNAGLTPARCSI